MSSVDDLLKLRHAQVKNQVSTGFFRDGARRIDVVLVVRDNTKTSVEVTKVQLLLNAIKSGLHLECEPGVVSVHSKLLFVKVHAPEAVLENYADYYNMRSYFKQSRLQFFNSKAYWHKFCPRMSSTREYEGEWIKIVRAQYGRSEFSNMERSRIVYQILLNLPFGRLESQVGITRLLANKTILDVYALHDGPYFYLKNQDMWDVNARQLLYYNWVRKRNMFKFQPLCLLNEYFGDRVSLYFAFISYYNHALMVTAVVGVIVTVCEVFDTTDRIIVNETCTDNSTVICPQCRRFRMCPFMKLSDYCLTATIINIIDNPYTIYYALFVSIWAICFIGLWRRRESYWCWLWELDRSEDNIRPDYVINYNEVTRSSLTGILKAYESPKRRTIRLALTFAIVFVLIVTVFCVIALMIMFKYWLKFMFSDHAAEPARQYMISALYGAVSVLILLSLDEACRKLSYTLTKFENHRNQGTYERSLIIKLYVFTFAFTFSMLIFFSYIKGAFYTYPSDPYNWHTLLGIGMMTCSPFGCLDEVWILLSVTLIFKQIALRTWYSIKRMRTDYNEGYVINSRVPCWEREYRLKPVTEQVMVELYRDLVTQFGSLTLFVSAFPLAPACALLANIWDVRFKARQFLLGFRRPLLPKSAGLGSWRDILLAVAYATALTNGLSIAMTTKTIQRYFYLMEHDTLDGFLMSTMSVFDVKDYLTETGPGSPREQFLKYDQFKPERYCLYTGQRYPPNSEFKYQLTGKHWNIKYYELIFIVVFEHGVFALVFLFHYVIPAVPRDIQETLAVENRIKNMRGIANKWRN